jgi:hypothetical protein
MRKPVRLDHACPPSKTLPPIWAPGLFFVTLPDHPSFTFVRQSVVTRETIYHEGREAHEALFFERLLFVSFVPFVSSR